MDKNLNNYSKHIDDDRILYIGLRDRFVCCDYCKEVNVKINHFDYGFFNSTFTRFFCLKRKKE